MTKEDEAKVRDLIKTSIDKELKKEKEDFEKMVTKMIKDSSKPQKDEFMVAVKKEIESLDKKFLTKQQVKELMINAFLKQSRFMFEKSKFITSYFNDL